MNKCQSVWEEQTGNKLHELKPDFNSKCSFLGYSRQIQTKITRCRIGHTRLTHSYSLTNEQPPFCYTPGIYAAGYIVFALTFVRSSVRMFVR